MNFSSITVSIIDHLFLSTVLFRYKDGVFHSHDIRIVFLSRSWFAICLILHDRKLNRCEEDSVSRFEVTLRQESRSYIETNLYYIFWSQMFHCVTDSIELYITCALQRTNCTGLHVLHLNNVCCNLKQVLQVPCFLRASPGIQKVFHSETLFHWAYLSYILISLWNTFHLHF